jgi:solute:Na+ symporter, SSS family
VLFRSNLSSHFNVRASVLTNDVYRRLCRPNAGERELVTAGRAMTIVVGGLTMVMAVLLAGASAEDLFKYMVSLAGCTIAPLGLPMLVGLVSRRVTPRSVAMAVIVGTVLSVVLYICLPSSVIVQGWNSQLVEGVAQKVVAFSIPFNREVVTFAFSFLVVMAIMFGHSYRWPMTDAESQRADLFHQRLATPVGQLPEDQSAAGQQEEPFSPFRLVGICVVCIGLLMLSIQPWIEAGLARWLNVTLGLLLIVLGALMMWASWFSRRAKANLKTRQANEGIIG